MKFNHQSKNIIIPKIKIIKCLIATVFSPICNLHQHLKGEDKGAGERNPRFLTQTGNDKLPLPLPSKLTTLSVPVRSYYFEKGKFDGRQVQ